MFKQTEHIIHSQKRFVSVITGRLKTKAVCNKIEHRNKNPIDILRLKESTILLGKAMLQPSHDIFAVPSKQAK